MSRHLLIISALVALTTAMVAQASSWNYSPSSTYGPHNWALDNADCNKSAQSPINFGVVDVSTTLQPFTMNWDSSVNHIAAGATIENNGHAIKLSVNGTGQQKLILADPNSQGKTYELQQFHFHGPSEHTFGGGLRDMEMHMVHQADDGSYLVVGVTFMASPNGGNSFLNNFWEAIPGLNYENGGATLPADNFTAANFDLMDVLPASRDFFTYPGSFTTPPCTEGVTWYVMEQANTMSTAQLAAFMKTIDLQSSVWDGTSQFYSRGTNRPTLPVNGRSVKKYSAATSAFTPPTTATPTSITTTTSSTLVGGAAAPTNTETSVPAAENVEDVKATESADTAPSWVGPISIVAAIVGLAALIVAVVAVIRVGMAAGRSAETSVDDFSDIRKKKKARRHEEI